MKKNYTAVIVCFLLLMFAASCTYAPANEHTDKLNIVATNFPAYDFCREIAGDKADITMLLSPGEESHSFDPTPMDILKLNKADIFVCGGGESDEWAETILSSCDNNITCIKMMDYANLFEEEISEGMEVKKESEEMTEYDEHVWTSPVNALHICKAIADTLCRLDNKNSIYYNKAFDIYTEKLMKIDDELRMVTKSAKRNELIFADRFPLLYFVKEYGLSYSAAFPGCSGETEASPSTIGFLIKTVRQKKIPYILKLELSSDSMAKSISNQTGAEILTFYSCQTISRDDYENGETYLSLMKKNVETLNKVLN